MTRHTVICDFGDVVVVPFPFVDRPVSKTRPAVVLSAHSFNAANDHSVCVMVTTAAGSTWPSDIPIVDGASAGLTHRSLVRWKVFTLPNQWILRKAGTLAAKDKAVVARTARKSLAN
jgi:mRNA interferase MazF